MTIDEFLENSENTAEWLADASGISAVSLSRIRRGAQNTSRDVMRRIIAASDNMITAAGLLHAPTDTPARAPLSGGNEGANSAAAPQVVETSA